MKIQKIILLSISFLFTTEVLLAGGGGGGGGGSISYPPGPGCPYPAPVYHVHNDSKQSTRTVFSAIVAAACAVATGTNQQVLDAITKSKKSFPKGISPYQVQFGVATIVGLGIFMLANKIIS